MVWLHGYHSQSWVVYGIVLPTFCRFRFCFSYNNQWYPMVVSIISPKVGNGCQVSWSGRSTSRWPTRVASRAAPINWWTAATPSGRAPFSPCCTRPFARVGLTWSFQRSIAGFWIHVSDIFKKKWIFGEFRKWTIVMNNIELNPSLFVFQTQVRARALADVHLVGVSASKWWLEG